MLFRKFIISKNELCPCSSGKKYKDCCYTKSHRKFHNEAEYLAVTNKVLKKSRIKTCLHSDCTAKSRDIILAHAMQKNRILSKLCVENQVLMQNTKDNPVMLEIKKGKPEPFYFLEPVHIKNATVSTCFCGKHDNSLFANIEKEGCDFSPNNKEQIFLFAYKTFAFEYYKEIVNSKFYTNMCAEVPQVFKNPFLVRNYRESVLKKVEMDHYKEIFDKCLIEKKYEEFESVVIEIQQQIQFAAYMCVAPPFDIKGKKINVIDNKSRMMRRLFVTIFPESDKSYIIITCHKDDLSIYETYLNIIRTSSIGLVKYYFNTFIPLYTENLIISPKLWDKWGELGQLGIQYAVAETRVAPLLKGLQFYLKNISKQEKVDIDTTNVKFNFFIED